MSHFETYFNIFNQGKFRRNEERAKDVDHETTLSFQKEISDILYQ